MADAAARVAGLLAAEAAATAVTGVVTAAIGGATLAAVAGNVANLTALNPTGQQPSKFRMKSDESHLVALSAGLATTATAGRAVAGDVAGLGAAVAGLGVLGTFGAITACLSVRFYLWRHSRLVCTHSCDPRLRIATRSVSSRCPDEARQAVKRAYHHSCSCFYCQ